jgi:acyl carrier protein
MDRAAQNLTVALKKMVIQECRVQNVTSEEINDSDPVIGSLGPHQKVQLDSLDAVEIATSLERNLGIKAEGMGSMKNIFRSYKAFSDYVAKNAEKERLENFLIKFQ